jgi:hypothetical protein
MAAVKRGKPRASGRGHLAPGKRPRRAPPAAAPNALPADDDDATLAEARTFEGEADERGASLEGEADERGASLEGVVDDWAGIDTVADMVDDPTEGRRRR